MNESVTLARDVEAAVIPVGTKVTLQKGEQAFITQSLGGSYPMFESLPTASAFASWSAIL